MNYFSIILVFSTPFLLTICTGQECGEKGLRKFDTDLAKLLTIGNSGRKYPTSLGQPLIKWCEETQVYINEIEKYKTKCLQDVAKKVVGVLVYSLKHTVIRQYCKKDKVKMAGLIDAATCVNRNDQIVSRCYTKMIDAVLGAKNAEDKKKLPHLCCEYNRLFECFDKKLTKAPGCNEQHVDAASGLVKSIVGNAIDLACEDYSDGSDKCDSLGPTPKKKKGERKWKSIAPPLLELLSSYDFTAEE